jgi:tetratricopeptide (TPR) repeat protein
VGLFIAGQPAEKNEKVPEWIICHPYRNAYFTFKNGMKPIIAILSISALMSSYASAQDAASSYDEGVKLKNDKKPAEAIAKFKQVSSTDINYTAAQYEMGWCLNDTRDYAGAMASLRKARSGWPAIPKVFFELGYAFEKQNMIDSATATYNECLKLKPDYSLAHKQLGFIAYSKDQYPAAISHFNNYITHTKVGIADYIFWYRKGFSENADKKFTDAKQSLHRSVSLKNDYINTYLELGFACNKLKEADSAINWFNQANKIDPKSHIPYTGIAEVYRDVKKDMDMAINWYQKALTVKTDERKACFGMGYCLNSKQKYTEAIPYLKKAIEQETTYTAAYVELGYSLYMTGNNPDALTQLTKALELNPKNENARYYSGLVYINQKDKVRAQQMVNELQGLSSKNAATLQEKVNKM